MILMDLNGMFTFIISISAYHPKTLIYIFNLEDKRNCFFFHSFIFDLIVTDSEYVYIFCHGCNLQNLDPGSIQLFKKLDIATLVIGDYLGNLYHFLFVNLRMNIWQTFIFCGCWIFWITNLRLGFRLCIPLCSMDWVGY
jgi:hypothetical protein